MSMRLGIAAIAMWATLSTPAFAQASNVDIARQYTDLVRKKGGHAAEHLLAPTIVWGNQKNPEGKEIDPGVYGIHLAVSNVMIGDIASIACDAVDEVEVVCTFARTSPYGDGTKEIAERYFVDSGKIVKVVSYIPPEFAHLKRDESQGNE